MNDVTQRDILEAVRESAVLADVSISMWGGTKTDGKLLNDLKHQHGATGDVGTVNKKLLAGADELLKKTRSAFSAVRLRHYALTLPWVSDPHATRQEGARLLPHLITERYMAEMSALKRTAINTLEEFLAAYPDLIVQAKANLGGMAGTTKYPTVDELRSSFRVHFDFEPLPAASNFKGLDDFMLERLTKGLHKKQQRQIADASSAMWKRAAKPVRKLIERLEEADTTIKQPTIEALREIVTLLPGWNLTGDPQMAEVTEEINELISGLDAKTLRTNEAVRTDVIQGAKRVQDKLVQWGL